MLKPIQDRVLIKRLSEEEMSPGGLYIPPNAQEKPARGIVFAVGDGEVLEDGRVRPLSVKAKDEVLFGKYAGTEVTIDGEEYLIMRESDILGIVENNNE